MNEFDQKQAKVQALLKDKGLDALLLRRVSSVAWATCGAATYINTATTEGAASLLITPTHRYVITNNIEARRLEVEEGLGKQGWELKAPYWHDSPDLVGELARGLKLGADVAYPGAANLAGEISRLRARLTPEEDERFRILGRLCAEAMDRAARAIRPGQTEYEIAAILAHETQARGAQPIVNLIATDERIFNYRHPLPKDKKMERYAMLVLCGRKWGLVCSITRLVHFGRLPDEVRRKMEATAQVDAAFIAATRPGARLNAILDRAAQAYAAAGFPDEWHLHHQGGPAGYEPREYLATPSAADEVYEGQVYAWNPSITGTKSEDSVLVTGQGCQVLTGIDGWPMLEVKVDGQAIPRPAILQVA